jgi:hypothetical protein
MEFFTSSRNESRGRRAETGWFRSNRATLLYIVFWLTIIAIAVAL